MKKEEIVKNKILVISKYAFEVNIFLTPEELTTIMKYYIEAANKRTIINVINQLDNFIIRLGEYNTTKVIVDNLKEKAGVQSSNVMESTGVERGRAFIKTNPNVVPYIPESNKAA